MKKSILLLAVIACLFSCQKETVNPEINSTSSSSLSETAATSRSVVPEVEDGILFFENDTHLHKYYDQLEEIIDTSDQDSVLAIVELDLPYFSRRAAFNEEYNWPYGSYTDEEIEEMETSDFISNTILKSVYNEHYEVGIGEYVFIKFAPSHTLKVEKAEQGLIDIIRDKKKGNKYDAILLAKEYEEIHLISQVIVVTKGKLVVNENREYRSTSVIENVPCSSFERILNLEFKIWNQVDGVWYPQNYVWDNVVIDWGDNSTSSIGTASSHTTSHIYGSTGVKNIKVSYYFTGLDNVPAIIEDEFSTDVSSSCTTGHFQKWDQKIDGNIKMTAKFWVNEVIHQDDLIGIDICTNTRLFKKNWKGEWSLAWGRVYTKIDNCGVRDDDCSFFAPVHEFKLRDWDRQVEKCVRVHNYPYYSNGDMKSWHSVEKNGTYLTIALSHDPC